jgi:hypothetical protein
MAMHHNPSAPFAMVSGLSASVPERTSAKGATDV